MPAGLRPYRNLIIDLDDTLLVELGSALESFRCAAELLRSLHPGVDAAEFASCAKACAREAWHELPTIDYARRIGISSWEGLWAEFGDEDEGQRALKALKPGYRLRAWEKALARYGIEDRPLAARLSDTYVRERKSRHRLFDDALPFLDALDRGRYRYALLTNGSPDLQRLKLRESGLAERFKEVFISGEIGWRKPEPEAFEACLSRLGWPREGTAMIGDSLESDVAGARRAGIASVWLNREGLRPDPLAPPDHEASGLDGVLGAIGWSLPPE